MGRYITEIGTASSVIKNVSGTFTATVNDRILSDSSSSAFTITLPAGATLIIGDQIQIIDVTSSFNTNNVTIDRNGSKINGATDNLTLDIDGAAVTVLYTGATYGWAITST